MRTRGVLRASRSLDEHVPQLAAALAGHGGGDPKAARFVDGFVRPFGRTQAATPRFVDAVERVAAMPAPERARAGTGAGLAHLLLFPLACLLSIHLRTQPWRKRTRNRIRKSYERQKLSVLRWVKQRVTDQFISAGKRRKKATPIAASTLTPKAGRQRDPAKTLAGTEFREAKETRELVTVLGRSGKPIILGPWLSETGFELLYWIPFLAWAKAYGNFDPDRLIVVSRGGAAPWYRHITPHYEEIFSFFTPDEFRVANERRIVEQGGRQKHIEVTSFDREILARVQARRGLSGAELLHPSQMYQLFDNFWLQRTPVTLIEAFSVFTTLPAPPPSGILAQLPEQYVAAKFYGNVALPPTPENRQFVTSYLADLASRRGRGAVEHRAALRRPRRLPAKSAWKTAHHRSPDDAGEQPGGADRGHSRRARLRGHLRRLLVSCAALRHQYPGVLFTRERVPLRSSRGCQARVLGTRRPLGAKQALRCGTFTEVDLRATEVLRLGFAGADHTSIGAAR